MQYFRNTQRCSMGHADPADMVPLCRYDRTPPKEAEVSRSRNGTGAAVNTACGCKSSSSVASCGCENSPTSEAFGCTGLAMAFVPEQEFCDMNDPDVALCRGSLFQKLDMPFYGKKGRCGK